MDEAEEGQGKFVEPREDAPELLDLAEEALHQVTLPVQMEQGIQGILQDIKPDWTAA